MGAAPPSAAAERVGYHTVCSALTATAFAAPLGKGRCRFSFTRPIVSMAIFSRDDSDSAALILWASVCLTMLRLSLEAATWLVLWQVYGRQTVARLHLSMVRIKPELVVSNGDVLRGFGPIHYFYGVGLWIPSSAVVLILITKYLAPRWWKKACAEQRKMRPRAIGVIVTLLLFGAIGGTLPLFPAISLGALGTAASTWWLRNSVREDPWDCY